MIGTKIDLKEFHLDTADRRWLKIEQSYIILKPDGFMSVFFKGEYEDLDEKTGLFLPERSHVEREVQLSMIDSVEISWMNSETVYGLWIGEDLFACGKLGKLRDVKEKVVSCLKKSKRQL